MVQHNQAKAALRTDRRNIMAVEYAIMTAFVAVAVVFAIGTVTPRLTTAMAAATAPMGIMR